MNKTKYLTGLLTALLISTAAAVTPTPTRSPSPTASPSATPTPSPIPVSPNFTVSWDANPASDNVTKYIVSYGPAPRSAAADFTYPSNVDVITSATALALKAQPTGKLYLSVRAVSSGGTSAYSNELVLDVKAGAPAVPSGLRITVTGLTLNLKPGKYSVTMSGKRRKGSIGTIEIVPQR